MRLDLFFAGMQNKETTASAWLATLLRDQPAFRAAFLAKIGLVEAEDVVWAVRVETPLAGGACDVTLECETDLVLIENKVSPSSVTEGQLLRYYRGAIEDAHRRSKRIVAVYLTPHASTGAGEVRLLRDSEPFRARASARGDLAQHLSWDRDVPLLVAEAAGVDDWFLHAGLEAIRGHIDRLARGRPVDEQREELKRLMARVSAAIATKCASSGEGWPVYQRWASRKQEAWYTPDRPVTAWLTLRYDEADTPDARVGDVFVDGLVRVQALVTVNPSTKIGLRDQALMDRWNSLVETGSVDVAGIGPLELRGEIAFEQATRFSGTVEALEAMLVRWGLGALRFARDLEG
jgi:hypothetical protein